MNILNNNKQIIFLDTNSSDKTASNSYIFINPVKTIIAFDETELEAAFAEITELSQKYWLAGYVRYEAGYCFLSKIFHNKSVDAVIRKPLIWFGVYDKPVDMSGDISGLFYKPYSNS